jgi:hypothetical protein
MKKISRVTHLVITTYTAHDQKKDRQLPSRCRGTKSGTEQADKSKSGDPQDDEAA